MRELIIGIDGGGTKTNLVAVDIQTGLIAATSTVGSIHISTQGEAAALRLLRCLPQPRIGIYGMEIGNYRCGPTSTVIGAAVLQAIVCGVAARLQECGMMPEIFCSSNVDGSDALNHVLIERYRQEIPML